MSINLTFIGQIRGGKNNMIVTRKGMHFPKPEWAAWRDNAVRQIRGQLPDGWKPFSTPCIDHIIYFAGDRRRRDRPAIEDAIFHVLERAGVIEDDCLLQDSRGFVQLYDKANPRLIIEIESL